MLSRGLQSLFTDIPLTLVGLIIFVGCFVAITGFTLLRKGARDHYRAISRLPLRESEDFTHE